MTAPITACTPRQSLASCSAPMPSEAANVAALPPPSDPMTTMMNGGDVGSAIAALVMQTEKELRKSARTGRDAAYEAQESAQREELAHMHDAASARFAAGMLQGGLQLASATASFAAVVPSAEANRTAAQIDPRQAPSAALLDRRASFEKSAGYAAAFAKSADAGSTLAPSIGRLISERSDESARAAGNRSAEAKRIAESHGDDVRDADHSLEKSVAFLKEWLSTHEAAKAAALHRA